MTEKTKSTTLTIRLPIEVKNILVKQAASENRSMGNMLQQIIRRYCGEIKS